MDPCAFDVYEVTAKAERPLPTPLGPTDTGQHVPFAEWLVYVERHFEQTLHGEERQNFKDYFAMGLTPSEAIQHDREVDEV